MSTPVIVEAVRTPVGKRGGSLSGWHPVELASEVLAAVVERSGIEADRIDDVILGCVSQVGPQSTNIPVEELLTRTTELKGVLKCEILAG